MTILRLNLQHEPFQTGLAQNPNQAPNSKLILRPKSKTDPRPQTEN